MDFNFEFFNVLAFSLTAAYILAVVSNFDNTFDFAPHTKFVTNTVNFDKLTMNTELYFAAVVFAAVCTLVFSSL